MNTTFSMHLVRFLVIFMTFVSFSAWLHYCSSQFPHFPGKRMTMMFFKICLVFFGQQIVMQVWKYFYFLKVFCFIGRKTKAVFIKSSFNIKGLVVLKGIQYNALTLSESSVAVYFSLHVRSFSPHVFRGVFSLFWEFLWLQSLLYIMVFPQKWRVMMLLEKLL